MGLSSNPSYCSHGPNQMLFMKKFAFCQHCETHWVLGKYAWIPDDDDRAYRGPEPKYQPKGKKKWKRKT